MVTDNLDFEDGVQFVSLVSHLQYACVIMFFNWNHGSYVSSNFSFTIRYEVVYISPSDTIHIGDVQDIPSREDEVVVRLNSTD